MKSNLTIDINVLFSAERTLLSWNRTSLAFMAFGFAIERGGLLMRGLMPSAVPQSQLWLAIAMGASLILMGVATAYYSARQYARLLRESAPPDLPAHYRASWGLWVNYFLAFFGLLFVLLMAWWHSS